MDTEKQRQHRCYDARLTESRNARSEQLPVPHQSIQVTLKRTAGHISDTPPGCYHGKNDSIGMISSH